MTTKTIAKQGNGRNSTGCSSHTTLTKGVQSKWGGAVQMPLQASQQCFAQPKISNARISSRTPVNWPRRTIVGRASSSDSPLLKDIQFLNPAFKAVETEAQFMGLLQKIVDSGRCPAKLLPLWQDFFDNYKSAIIGSNQPGANEKLVAQVSWHWIISAPNCW